MAVNYNTNRTTTEDVRDEFIGFLDKDGYPIMLPRRDVTLVHHSSKDGICRIWAINHSADGDGPEPGELYWEITTDEMADLVQQVLVRDVAAWCTEGFERFWNRFRAGNT